MPPDMPLVTVPAVVNIKLTLALNPKVYGCPLSRILPGVSDLIPTGIHTSAEQAS